MPNFRRLPYRKGFVIGLRFTTILRTDAVLHPEHVNIFRDDGTYLGFADYNLHDNNKWMVETDPDKDGLSNNTYCDYLDEAVTWLDKQKG